MRSFTYLGQGNGREVFLVDRGRWVVKVPLNRDGRLANLQEHQAFREGRIDSTLIGYLARCRLIPGTFLLVMERLALDVVRLPSWAACFDCAQVGYSRKGKLLVYDYAW